MIDILIAVALQQPPLFVPPMPPDYAHYSDTQLCAWAENFLATRGRQPFVRDALRRRDSVTGSCADRILTENWSILDTQENLGNVGIGWAGETYRDWSRETCTGPWSPYPAMTRRGWRIVTNYVFTDGARLSFTLQCQD